MTCRCRSPLPLLPPPSPAPTLPVAPFSSCPSPLPPLACTSPLLCHPSPLPSSYQPLFLPKVWDDRGPGFIRYDAAEVGRAEMGHVLENSAIQSALLAAIHEGNNGSAELMAPEEVESLELPPYKPSAGAAGTFPLSVLPPFSSIAFPPPSSILLPGRRISKRRLQCCPPPSSCAPPLLFLSAFSPRCSTTSLASLFLLPLPCRNANQDSRSSSSCRPSFSPSEQNCLYSLPETCQATPRWRPSASREEGTFAAGS